MGFAAVGFLTAEACSTTVKLNYLMVTRCQDLTKAEIMQWLPSVKEVEAMTNPPCGDEGGNYMAHFMCNQKIIAGIVCEMLGEGERGLEFLEGQIMLIGEGSAFKRPDRAEMRAWVRGGGASRPLSWIVAGCTKGRILASQGKQAEAIAVFEMAYSTAETLKLWLLALLCLRDLRMSVSEADAVLSCDQRLGGCLRRINSSSTPAECDFFLNNSFAYGYTQEMSFDAAHLMLL